MPPSEVGVGIIASEVVGRIRSGFFDGKSDLGRSINAMYIWVVKRFGMFVGVIQRVKGIRDPSCLDQHWLCRRCVRITCVDNTALGLYPVGKSKPSGMYFFSSSFSFFLRYL